MRAKKKRFTVSLPQPDYQKLVELAEGTRPQITYRFLVELAVLRFLESPELHVEIGNPMKKGKKDEK